MKSIQNLEKIAEALIALDNNFGDGKITISEFEKLKERRFTETNQSKKNKELLEILTGESINDISELNWSDFKDLVIEHQKEYGLNWKIGRGRSGTIILKEIKIPGAWGDEINTKLSGSKEIKTATQENPLNLYKWFKIQTPKLHQYLDIISKNDKNNRVVVDGISLYDLKKSLNDLVIDPKLQITFLPRKYDFYRWPGVIKYKGKEQQLGKQIISKLERNFGDIEVNIYDTQDLRKGEKYENIDLIGIRIVPHLKSDNIDIYSFELKPSNDVADISKAISQAVNYKKYANYTYIVIPFFDAQSFHDRKRLKYFYNLCVENQIGAISVNFDLDSDDQKIEDVFTVVKAPKINVSDLRWLKILLSGKLQAHNEFDEKSIKHGKCKKCDRGTVEEFDGKKYCTNCDRKTRKELNEELISRYKREYCPVCNKIVYSNERMEDCGWIVSDDSTERKLEYCKKEIEDKNSLNLQKFLLQTNDDIKTEQNS